MDIKTKIFWWVIGLLTVFSLVFAFYRYMIKKDYIIQAQTDCDPYMETCFVWECDPASDVDGEKCTGDTENDIWYYKLIDRNAGKIPSCDLEDESCEALVCGDNEPECKYTLCNEENKIEMESEECTDPIKYSLENPIEEEGIVCEEGDTECFNNTQDDAEINEVDSEENEDLMVQTTNDIISSEEGEVVREGKEAGDLPIAK